MAVVLTRNLERPSPEEAIPRLEVGDHLDRATFHERYEAMHTDQKWELIGGVVYMASPAKIRHGRYTAKVVAWLDGYEASTAGVDVFDNTTVLLADDSEPQPDVSLAISPGRGGQTSTDDDWMVGPPELVVEVASSSASYDLHNKKRDYERAGVREYVVVVVREPRVRWFVNRDGAFQELKPGQGGLYRSEVFPGLWLDPAALLRLDSKALRTALKRGLASAEHRRFVDRLNPPDRDE